MLDSPLFVLAMLAANVVLAEWLARATPLRHLGAALLVIVTTAVCANVGLMPTFGEGSPVYDRVFAEVAPLGIFWLLLGVNLRDVRRAGGPMVLLFLVGSAGTTVGVLAGMAALGGPSAFGPHGAALGGMFVGTYTGGSVNFNAVALHYGVVDDGVLYAGANLVDSAMTTVWMAACVFLPRALAPLWPTRHDGETTALVLDAPGEGDEETASPADLAVLLALGAGAVVASEALTDRVRAATGASFPSMIVLTTVALLLAQLRPVQRLRGARLGGMLAVMVFLAVIGALCDVSALRAAGPLGLRLTGFVAVAVGVHALITFGAARALRLDPRMAAVASQANVGGGTTALALARSLDRADLVLPAILIGSLGTAVGNYLGFLTAGWLGG